MMVDREQGSQVFDWRTGRTRNVQCMRLAAMKTDGSRHVQELKGPNKEKKALRSFTTKRWF
jgi:hypothetical protein